MGSRSSKNFTLEFEQMWFMQMFNQASNIGTFLLPNTDFGSYGFFSTFIAFALKRP